MCLLKPTVGPAWFIWVAEARTMDAGGGLKVVTNQREGYGEKRRQFLRHKSIVDLEKILNAEFEFMIFPENPE